MTNDQALTVVEARAPLTVFGTDDPAAIVRRVTDIATPLADFIKARNMTTQMGNRIHVNIEGWSFMGAMLGVAPITTRVTELRDGDGGLCGFEAHVELRTRDGSVVGAGIGECSRMETMWGWHPVARDGRPLPPRDDFALKSMAQTRAAGKAYRLAFGFIMQAAGYDATPAEEMPAADAQPHEQTILPPQPRTPPRRAGAPAQQKAEWADELKSAMEQAECSFEDIERFLQARPTNANIEGWLREHAPSGVSDLVALAMPVSAEPF